MRLHRRARSKSDTVRLVTGGSGTIGAAICRALARRGASLALTYHKREERAQALCAELEEQGGARCFAAAVDGCDGAAVNAFVKEVEQRFERVDVLINNLGATQVMPFALIEEEDWDQMMLVNLKSMFLFSKAAARGMIRRKRGAIVNLGSIAGHRLLELPVHYAAAKAGVTGFTVSLAKELCRYGVRVNAVAPGLIADGISKNVSDRQLAHYNSFCALGRPGTPEEVAELVVFAASDEAGYLDAQNLVLDGVLMPACVRHNIERR